MGRREKTIRQGVTPGPGPQRQPATVVVAHDQSADIGDSGEAVIATAMNLFLMLEEPMNGIADIFRHRHILADVERLVE